MSKKLLFDVSVAGTFDGTTVFNLPVPLPAPDANQQIVIPIVAAAGLLSPIDPGLLALIGGGGYWVVNTYINIGANPAVRFVVAITQPKPSGVSATAESIKHPIVAAGTNAAAAAQPFIKRGPYVPAGFGLVFYADDGAGTPVVGPYQVGLELETLPLLGDAARAIKSTEFEQAPIGFL